MNANDIKFRCSSLGHLMTEARIKSNILSESCITHLIDVFVSEKYNRREEASGKMIEKGNKREEDSITLYSRVSHQFFKKNTIHLENEFIKGTPDVFKGEEITKANEIIDTKTPWSAHTFFRSKNKPLDKMYWWQGQGYMDLTGAIKHTVAFCLINGIDTMITDEKKKLEWKYEITDPYTRPIEIKKAIIFDKFKDESKQIEINHIFDLKEFQSEYPFFQFDNDIEKWSWDIPMEDRLHLFTFERDQLAIDRMHQRVIDARKWMDENLFKEQQKSNSIVEDVFETLAAVTNPYSEKIKQDNELRKKTGI
jgi:hypothetical protein